MEDYIQFSAKTKSEAITKACIELGVSSDQLEIQVISEGSNGFFGIGSKPAVIKVRKIEPVSEEEEMKEIVETVKLDSFKEEAPVQEEKKTEAIKPVKKEIKEPKAVSEKPRQPKPVKERAAKEKQPREFREPKEKQVREKTAKPVKPAKPVEILTDPEEIKEVENRAKVFLLDVFASMNLGEVEITSEYNTTDGSLEVDFEGEDMGILAGDALLNYAFETACKAFEQFPEESLRIGQAMRVLARKAGIYGMIGGQVVDVKESGHQIDEEVLDFIFRLKTGALIESAMMIGAILAGASKEDVKSMQKIAGKIGMAFQIQDDILDVTSTTEQLGKPVHSDEKNEKTTYVTLKGIEQAHKDVERMTEEAIDELKKFPAGDNFLEQLLKSLVYREK